MVIIISAIYKCFAYVQISLYVYMYMRVVVCACRCQKGTSDPLETLRGGAGNQILVFKRTRLPSALSH